MTLITHGASSINPTEILGWNSARPSANIVHDILGREEPDITYRKAKRRKGTITLGFADATGEADSLAAENLLATGQTFTLYADRATVGMAFVVQGEIRRELEPETRDAWLVTFDYQEVTP